MSTTLSSAVSSPAQWDAHPPTKTRTVAKRRVYGKRRTDAPRAVFDQQTPPKQPSSLQQASVQDAVDSIQAKLAEINIDDTPTVRRQKDIVKKPRDENDTDSIHRKDAEPQVDDAPTELPQTEDQFVAPSSPMSTPRPQKRYETMVAVRVTPRYSMVRRRVQRKEAGSTSGNASRTRKVKPAPRLSSGCVTDEGINAYARPILDEAISPVAAQSVQKFSSWAARAGNLLEVVKIAEGSYGEVYKLRLREEVCKKAMSKSKLARLKAYGDGVFKIVPLRARRGPGSKKYTSVDEIVSEVRMLKYLDPIPGFARFREIHVVQGRFPESFQAAWDYYKETKDDCLNPDPSNRRAYPETQLWAIVEMDDAGCELEKFAWSSVFQIYDIFWGVAMALARAEEYAMFEHRDLHLGNVCIRSTRPNGCMDPPTDHDIMSRSYTSGFGLSTIETTIIDYSLSRAELRLSEESPDAVDIASSDLDQKQIFDAIGRDEDEVLLRNTYRYMRAQLYHGNPLETAKTRDIPGIWEEYAPRTNLIWLLFLLKTLLKNRKAEVSERQPLSLCSPNKQPKITKTPKSGCKDLDSPETKVANLKKDLEDRLNEVLRLLDLENGHQDICCAADLVAFAIDTNWLDERDFF
ncbi:haspin protein kinase [Aspergillus terreus]|uniref:non-specific serine/threonine protein kinase n=1 Tax=Aspergillus terreus TaxID=33178 RepID=A0A5M3YSI9_ASPTE|nr:hypothetical protein ATETN484_0003067900 [Aspergillus terreus]GFF14665.1 haspin protein kinase [Aspergillus terreus]